MRRVAKTYEWFESVLREILDTESGCCCGSLIPLDESDPSNEGQVVVLVVGDLNQNHIRSCPYVVAVMAMNKIRRKLQARRRKVAPPKDVSPTHREESR